MATHSSIVTWKIPWMKEPDGLQSWGRKESDVTEQLHFHFLSPGRLRCQRLCESCKFGESPRILLCSWIVFLDIDAFS